MIALSFGEMLGKLVNWLQEGYFWEQAYYGFFGQPDHLLKLREAGRSGPMLP